MSIADMDASDRFLLLYVLYDGMFGRMDGMVTEALVVGNDLLAMESVAENKTIEEWTWHDL